MAENFQVSCINKTPHSDPHRRIQQIGGVLANGTRWTLSEDAAIQSIKNGTYNFWTTAGGKSVWVIIAKHEGKEYLKTEADGVQPNNLLALPECPT